MACVFQKCSVIKVSKLRANKEENAIVWSSPSKYGELEISINLAKPEKNPRDIAKAAAQPKTAAMRSNPSAQGAEEGNCDLCRENAEWSAERELFANPALSATEFEMGGELWRIHFSPYGYFQEHNIIMTVDHHPMHIDSACIQHIFECTDRFPDYFTGSNADLPIVGGSILSHDHFQGGRHVFASMKAPVERRIEVPSLTQGGVTCGLVRWPVTMFRFEGVDPCALVDCAAALLRAWRGFDFPSANIVSRSIEATCSRENIEHNERVHNTITPIAYKKTFIESGKNAFDERKLKTQASAGGNSSDKALDEQKPKAQAGAGGNLPEKSLGKSLPEGASNKDNKDNKDRRSENGSYVLDVALRNNRCSKERPWGIFHPGEELHHIKRENIGLIEVMGLAILPPRVLEEYPQAASDECSQQTIADAFVQVLEACGVFKRDKNGDLTSGAEEALAALLEEAERESIGGSRLS